MGWNIPRSVFRDREPVTKSYSVPMSTTGEVVRGFDTPTVQLPSEKKVNKKRIIIAVVVSICVFFGIRYLTKKF